jgi:uncharacterized membrane protein
MMKSTLAGHPLHPQLIVAPAGLLPFSFIMDVMQRATGEQSYADAAYHSMWGGFFGALAAGAAGAVDYFSIPRESPVMRTANMHAGLNIGLVGMYAANLAMRRKGEPASAASLLLSGLGTAGLLVSAWYGGHMVYEQGMRVKDVDPIAQAPDLKLPVDETIRETFERLEESVAGPAAVEPPYLP